MTYLDEVEEIIGIPIEVKPLNKPQLADLGLNTCNHDIPFSSREVPSFDKPKPQPQPLRNYPSMVCSIGDEKALNHPINHFSRIVLDEVDPKNHCGFKPGLLGQNGSLGVDFLNLEVVLMKKKAWKFLGSFICRSLGGQLTVYRICSSPSIGVKPGEE
ncbi:hypothetical protein Tco_1107000 [Tanacetum coccineum]